MIHDFDTSLWLMGGPPCRVFAAGSQMMSELKGTSILDTVVATLTYKSGTQIAIEANRYSPGGLDQRLEAITRSATIIADNPLKSQVTVINTSNTLKDTFKFSFPQRYYEAYSNEVNHFLDMILNSAKPKITRNDCIQVVRIIQACSKSHQIGQAVELSESINN